MLALAAFSSGGVPESGCFKIWLGTVSWGLMEQALLILYTSTLYVLVPTGVIAPRPCAMLPSVEDCLLLMYVDPRPSSFGVRNHVVC